ncbi:DUF6508 domain-containing protein [Paenibacillus arenosi]|uniref:Uncharacterized protein n=1 Tax=Paenibacillus arenosi TaxID=2774142 RepID=A0ABR9ATG9_9BACL|nr:DUF6508 domain-containing protein [Paenibacillus arenosi]MBD8497307.1 hypothetical protein [Paenibacillus arenosi]
MHDADLSQTEINRLLMYLDYFQNQNTFTVQKNGYECENETIMEFRKALTETRFLIVFNWIDWLNEHEIYKDTSRDVVIPIRNADMETLRKLMTSYIRGDRFNEGLFIDVIKKGVVAAILERVKELQG